MFQIIAIVIFYFRSSPRVKRKRQKTIDQCRPRAWPWASETYVFLRSMSFCRIDRAERQFAGGRKPAGQIAYAVLGEAVLQGAGGLRRNCDGRCLEAACRITGQTMDLAVARRAYGRNPRFASCRRPHHPLFHIRPRPGRRNSGDAILSSPQKSGRCLCPAAH
jgi:hypothetical protein